MVNQRGQRLKGDVMYIGFLSRSSIFLRLSDYHFSICYVIIYLFFNNSSVKCFLPVIRVLSQVTVISSPFTFNWMPLYHEVTDFNKMILL